MGKLSFLELQTVYSESHIKLECYLKNEEEVTIGELSVYIFDNNLNDVKATTDSLDLVTAATVNSFEITYNGFLYDEFIKPFERTPYTIWGRIALIERLYIYPEHRREGYGSQVLNKLSRMLKDVYLADFIILKPYPLFGSKDESILEEVPTKRVIAEQIESLVSFYEKFRFQTQKVNKQYYQCINLLELLL